ncbi:polyamine aminopropyltransferase [Anaerovorax odorimutans]|uniref:polyamine aminopropyltransferase n=1 Tax=Anaerovorax odorimutans TaxID=109327 RepID=UPI000403C817|nr:polyamine aminopropyltransferase [Anaerovorax odorimutans]
MLIKNNDLWFSEYYMEDDVKLSLKIDEILYAERSPFQKIEIFKNKTFGVFMVLDGYIQVTEKDEFVYHDMISHPAMAVNPDIKNVLIIGAGDGGTAREISRYKTIEKIDMVEIDEAVVRACQKYMPITSSVFTNEPRLNLMFDDGLKFVKEAPSGAYDLILVDSTDPAGPGEGLFTIDFYKDCYRVLSEKGILINQHEGAFFDGDIEEMKKAHAKIKKTFPIAKVFGFNTPTYASGYWYFGFASKSFDPIADFKPEQWEKLGLETKYYNTDLHRGAFALPNYVLDILASVNV